jgi:hypothetical protein
MKPQQRRGVGWHDPVTGGNLDRALTQLYEWTATTTTAPPLRDGRRVRAQEPAVLADQARRGGPSPEPPATRTAERAALPGALLWRLVDWRPGVPEPVQAAVEAALQASGLWTPGGCPPARYGSTAMTPC